MSLTNFFYRINFKFKNWFKLERVLLAAGDWCFAMGASLKTSLPHLWLHRVSRQSPYEEANSLWHGFNINSGNLLSMTFRFRGMKRPMLWKSKNWRPSNLRQIESINGTILIVPICRRTSKRTKTLKGKSKQKVKIFRTQKGLPLPSPLLPHA